jgi:predicted glycoside hydrolase/deacetylase ChbG (UPF0249 family)
MAAPAIERRLRVRDERQRALIVNADDFGQCAGVNGGIIDAHEHGIVTSASLMVMWPASAAAAAYARRRPALSVGLHIDLGEWICVRDSWEAVYTRVDSRDPDAVEREVRTQLERCRDLLGTDPTHLDSHQHVHRNEPARAILRRVGEELGVPVRHFSPSVRYCGKFYGQDANGGPMPGLISASRLVALLQRLDEGVTELACHPGYASDLNSMYRDERAVESRTLCAGVVRQALVDAGIRLMSFREVQKDKGPGLRAEGSGRREP